MSLIEGLSIFVFIVVLYFLIVLILRKKGILEKYNISPYGPALLIKTEKGKGFLKKIAEKKRFWKAFGSFGIAFSLIMMVLMTFVLVLQIWTIMGLTAEEKASLPGPEVALVLPGINPILPLEYIGFIILALVVAIIVHEFSHGILTIVGKLKVKSMGILYLIIPIGAFVEPDEEKLKETDEIKRMRIFSAGPLANFTVVLVTILLFSFVFMSAVEPAADGITVVSVTSDSPAENNNISQGMIITSINDTNISNVVDFFLVMNNTKSGDTVNVTYYWHSYNQESVVLSDKYEEFEKKWPKLNKESYKGKGYIGISPNLADRYLSITKNPFNSFNDMLLLYVIPLWGYERGYNPIASPYTETYVINGPLGALPDSVFWGFVNAFYWIFWLNLAVGLFNILPMVPLDGGFIFNDTVTLFIKKTKKDISKERRELIVKNVSLVISLSILFLIIFPFFVKYL